MWEITSETKYFQMLQVHSWSVNILRRLLTGAEHRSPDIHLYPMRDSNQRSRKPHDNYFHLRCFYKVSDQAVHFRSDWLYFKHITHGNNTGH